jgi:uncharacterized protein (TIGR03435 family)
MSIDNARVYIGSTSVVELVCRAYNVSRSQVVGGPAWLSASNVERFEIVAKMPDGATKEQVPEMLQALLAERFKLVAHRERRDTSVYALVVGKGGPKLKEAVPAPASAGEASEASQGNKSVVNSRGSGPFRMKAGENGQVRIEYDSLTMEGFASVLSHYLDRPVVDQTGLKGSYQVSYETNLMAMASKARANLALAPRPASNPAAAADAILDPDDSIFSSVKQLGLKLDSRELPCDVVVIDHIERTPTKN